MPEELKPPHFPTMLRKMWSGAEVQAWIDEEWNRRAQPAAPADATEDELLDLEQALERRRILEEIKKVAEVHPADDMPTPFQSAWQQCCEEIFYRATEGQWHMDEDASRFAKNHAAPEPRQPMSACPHGVPHRWSCGECDTGVEMLAPADAAPSVAPEPVAWTLQSELDAAQTTCSAHLWFTNPRNSAWTALFTREQIAAHPPRAPLTREALAEIVRSHLTSTYHCTRVWGAWHVGTMTEDDFEPASESDMAEDIADAILANHPPRAPLTEEQIDAMWQAAYQELRDEPRCSFDWFEAGIRALEHAHGIGGK